MYQKILWIVVAALLVSLGFWLGRVMPSQAWAQWDGQHWQIVAESWAVLGRGWPLAVLGALGGALAAGVGLAFTLKHAQEADFRAEIARLTRQRDEAERRVREREQAARHREAVALETQRGAELARQEAQAARRQAEQAQEEAEQAVSQANYRARNAIGAAERIKRRIEGKKRLDAGTSAP